MAIPRAVAGVALIGPGGDRRAAAAYEDLAARLDAGLPAAEGLTLTPGAALRARGFAAREWEWAALAAGERAGNAPHVMRELARARRDRADLVDALAARLAYPALVLALAIALAVVLGALGLPVPRGFLPAAAAMAIAVCGIVAVARWRLRDPALAIERVPWLGQLARAAGELPYLAALRSLYGAGVPLRSAHRQAVAAARGAWQRARLLAVAPALDAGEPFAASLAARAALTPESLALIRDGEAAGDLEGALGRAVDRRRQELLAGAGLAARVLGTVVYLAAAGSVLWIALAFYGGMLGRLTG